VHLFQDSEIKLIFEEKRNIRPSLEILSCSSSSQTEMCRKVKGKAIPLTGCGGP
jgi:hypothetical protein